MTETMTWTLVVTFSQTDEGWVLTELDVEPKAGPGVFDAIARVAAKVATMEGPVSGGFWNGAP